MKQLDIDASLPAFVWKYYLTLVSVTLTLTHVTFDLDHRDLLLPPSFYTFRDMNFFLV